MNVKELSEERQIGNNDLRAECDGAGGFWHVSLRDADDGDVIIVNEDDVEALRDYLNLVLHAMAKSRIPPREHDNLCFCPECLGSRRKR